MLLIHKLLFLAAALAIISFYFRGFIILNSRQNTRSYWRCPKNGKN